MADGSQHHSSRATLSNQRQRQCRASYYISSLSANHKLLGHYIWQHWRIENSEHYVLDFIFKGDNPRITLDGSMTIGHESSSGYKFIKVCSGPSRERGDPT